MYRYAILGLLQGLTEFLPVSSSGHLVLVQALWGMDPPGVLLEAVLHLGTLVAVLLYFWRDIRRLLGRGVRREGREERRYLGLLALGTVPIVIGGLWARDLVEAAFSSVGLVGGMLLVTSLLLWLGGRFSGRATVPGLGIRSAVLVGLAQAAALLPGISRSGATISTGILAKVRPEEAARFSFLLSIPAVLGAGILSLGEALGAGLPKGEWAGISIGAAISVASGLVAIHWLLAAVRRGRLWPFALYCAALGTASLSFFGITAL